ncbi:MAG: sigma-70 family RNA polymerase sigma factor [Niabella sp.]|nr:MAG: sigma-70 family RNA polymerase sigma factor [Niabella sp.]
MFSDETLWSGVMNGDRQMFLSLYNRYYHTLLFIGLKRAKDDELVKDCIQQVFLYIWEKRTTMNVVLNVRAYLIISMLRRVSAEIKKANRQVWYDDEPEVLLNYVSETPEEKLIKKHEEHNLVSSLKTLIDALPHRQKELIELRFYKGLSYEEIVEHTGLSYRTVYNKIYEALKKLRLSVETKQQSVLVSLLMMTL